MLRRRRPIVSRAEVGADRRDAADVFARAGREERLVAGWRSGRTKKNNMYKRQRNKDKNT